jgi:hypothetical protein
MKKILFTLCLAAALTGARGQIYIDSYRFGVAVSSDLLLDSFPNAAAAFSLRKLDKDYSGNCIIIRRSSGSPALDTIGFSGDYVDTARIKTFCSGVNCFVRLWYDQSGNGKNAEMSTDANQPRIVSSGTLDIDGGEVTINFDGTNDNLQVASLGLDAYMTIVVNTKCTTSKQLFIEHGTNANSTNGFYLYGTNTYSWSMYRDADVHRAEGVNLWLGSNEKIASFVYDGNGAFYDNETAEANNAINGTSRSDSNVSATLHFYSRAGTGVFSQGYTKEFIIWNEPQSSVLTIIRNLNRFYSIY